MQRRNQPQPKNRHCYFCFNGITVVDHSNGDLLKKFMSSHAKIVPRRRSGVCALHQRKLARSIKHARIMGIVPFLIQ